MTGIMPPAEAYRAAAAALIPCLPEAVLVPVLSFLTSQLTNTRDEAEPSQKCAKQPPSNGIEEVKPRDCTLKAEPDALWEQLMATAATMPKITLARSLNISKSTLGNWRINARVPDAARKRVASWIRMHSGLTHKGNGHEKPVTAPSRSVDNGHKTSASGEAPDALDIEAVQAAAAGRDAESLAGEIGISRRAADSLLEANDAEDCCLSPGERKRTNHWLALQPHAG
jgi:hypothetical protein